MIMNFFLIIFPLKGKYICIYYNFNSRPEEIFLFDRERKRKTELSYDICKNNDFLYYFVLFSF